jgi:DNA repair photolyase
MHLIDDGEQLSADELPAAPRRVPTELFPDQTRSIVATNDSPDIPFRWSINPYRGCEHGCAYCYARPYHELLGMNAGLDFETKILVKYDAPQLLRAHLCRPSWEGEVIAISGVTDCYQPVERKLALTRGCLEVMLEARQPTRIATKNALVARDLDLIAPMADRRLMQVVLSVTTLDKDLARTMEPRTSTPPAKLRAIERLSAAGVPVGVLIAPVIPGLTDHEIPKILAAAKDAGARFASWLLLRLPLSVEQVFLDWLNANRPEARPRVESRIRETRDGCLSDCQFGRRLTGRGSYAQGIADTFDVFARQYGLDGPAPHLDSSQFRPPREGSGQGWLF